MDAAPLGTDSPAPSATAAPGGVRFLVPDATLLVDDPVSCVLGGAPPGETVTISAALTDRRGLTFASKATYRALPDGTVDPSVQAPLDGSYAGVDPFGLWWSMSSEPERPIGPGVAPLETRLSAKIRGQLHASVVCSRARLGPGVRTEKLDHAGVVGRLFIPAVGHGCGVLILGGSEGGSAFAVETAALLASRGMVALALAYFGAPGLPATLAEIPVEYFARAIDALAAQPEVVGRGIGVVGVSRGGEAALLIGSRVSTVQAVVAIVASPVLWGGSRGRSAWSEGGVGLPWVPFIRRPSPNPRGRPALDGTQDAPVVLRERFERRLQNPHAHPETRLAIERTGGPILLVSGEDDKVWPSSPMAEQAMRRLAAACRPFPDRHLSYPGAGHGIGRPPGLPAAPTTAVHPVTGVLHDLGGTREANARANSHAWPAVLAFLADNLR